MIANDIAAYLVTSGYGTLGTSIFIDQYPPTPDEAICVYALGGGPPGRCDAGTALEEPKFSVVVRSADPATAQSQCEAIRQALDNQTLTVGSNKYWYVQTLLPEPVGLGPDETDVRWKYSCDFQANIIR